MIASTPATVTLEREGPAPRRGVASSEAGPTQRICLRQRNRLVRSRRGELVGGRRQRILQDGKDAVSRCEQRHNDYGRRQWRAPIARSVVYQVALVGSPDVDPDVLAGLGAALNKQAQQVAAVWGIAGVVSAFASLDVVPAGYWPIQLLGQVPGGAAGVHFDTNNQPYALVELTANWPLVASHECVEMLVDPLGSKVMAGQSPIPGQGTVNFLVEICDPCQDPQNGYMIDQFLVSDFCTPQYFGAAATTGKFSFNGSINLALQILENGALTWFEPAKSQWWQRQIVDGSPQDQQIPGPVAGLTMGLREALHRESNAHQHFATAVRAHPWHELRERLAAASKSRAAARAERIRRAIRELGVELP